MKYRFHTAAELMEILHTEHLALEEYALKREAFIWGIPEKAVQDELDRRIAVTRRSLIKGLAAPQRSRSGLTQGAAVSYYGAARRFMHSRLFRRAASYALSINEVNACGGKIVAFPTAGSCGIAPGAIWAWWDTCQGDTEAETAVPPPGIPEMIEPPYDPKLRGAFLVSSLTGVLIAQGATLAGAEGGCQAECGGAGAMAACALGYLEALPTEDCFSAAALSLKNTLGLACDPVAGLVEIPCVKRNAFIAVNALLAVDLTLSGIRSAIPFDEVVLAMKQIGDAMPAGIRETAAGGLAVTPTALAVKEKLDASAD
ncbi:MAG: L-serine ammonia-lyase, iron-sulfur-dependent, subunit alpha [Treponema sp.]|jgi:L-serine dehydratase|nr:L-serine ammonia-lyase, iron-sulfur-dependent, subunit alpha [Treponema sp.]